MTPNFDLPITTISIIAVEGVLLLFQVFNYLSRTSDRSRLRFLLLTLSFIFYNATSYYIPYSLYDLTNFWVGVFAFLRGAILGCHYFIYLVQELNLKQEDFFSTKALIYSLAIVLTGGGFLPYFISGGYEDPILIMRIAPVILSIYVATLTFSYLKSERELRHFNHPTERGMVRAGYVGILFVASMPVSVFFDDMKYFNVMIVNVAYIITCYAYFLRHRHELKLEAEFLSSSGYFDQQRNGTVQYTDDITLYNLTARELEMAKLIGTGKIYKLIAEEVHITPKTVSKHASNIFKKTECSDREEFLEKFKRYYTNQKQHPNQIDQGIVNE